SAPPTAPGSASSPSLSASAASPSNPTYADTLRVGLTDTSPWSNAGFTDELTRFVLSGLYRYDDQLAPQPDLADGPCQVAANDVVITCHLVQTTFHDGTPLTADDVVSTYQIRMSKSCIDLNLVLCLNRLVAGVSAVDPLTVQFTLPNVDPTFFTSVMPS